MYFINLGRQQQANRPNQFSLMSQLHSHGHILNQVRHSQIQSLEFESEFAVLFGEPINGPFVVGELGGFLVGLGLVLHGGVGVGGWA